jgi:predicted acylesterase/phospholipase RssA
VGIGLAFEGCAGRAAFQVGVAARLHEEGVRPVAVAGASSGSIVAALIAGGYAARIEEIWLAAAGRPVFQPARLLRGGWPFAMSAVVGDALEREFGSRRLPDLALPIAIPVTLLSPRGRRQRILTRADDIGVVEAVLASCFIPGPYSRVVRIDGSIGFDGAWQIRTPVDAVRELGASRVLAVVANPAGELRLDFPTRGTAPERSDCLVISPRAELPVAAWDTDPGRIRAAIAAGRLAAGGLRLASIPNEPQSP